MKDLIKFCIHSRSGEYSEVHLSIHFVYTNYIFFLDITYTFFGFIWNTTVSWIFKSHTTWTLLYFTISFRHYHRQIRKPYWLQWSCDWHLSWSYFPVGNFHWWKLCHVTNHLVEASSEKKSMFSLSGKVVISVGIQLKIEGNIIIYLLNSCPGICWDWVAMYLPV